jgi:putative oxidoreductase
MNRLADNRLADVTLLIGRLALIALFVISATGKFTNLSGTAATLASKGLPAPMVLATVAAVGELAGALGVAVGLFTRVAALGLVVFTILASITIHNYWILEGAARQGQFIHFMKNVGIIGGLLIVFGVGPGAFSLDAFRSRRRG